MLSACVMSFWLILWLVSKIPVMEGINSEEPIHGNVTMFKDESHGTPVARDLCK